MNNENLKAVFRILGICVLLACGVYLLAALCACPHTEYGSVRGRPRLFFTMADVPLFEIHTGRDSPGSFTFCVNSFRMWLLIFSSMCGTALVFLSDIFVSFMDKTENGNHQVKQWHHSIALLLVLMCGLVVLSLIPVSGEWSCRRSEWLRPALVLVLTIGLSVATHWLYRRPNSLHKVQASALWLLFGTIAVFAVLDCVEYIMK